MKYKISEEQHKKLIDTKKKKNKLEKELIDSINKIRDSLYVEQLISNSIVDKINHYKKKYGVSMDSVVMSLFKNNIIGQNEYDELTSK